MADVDAVASEFVALDKAHEVLCAEGYRERLLSLYETTPLRFDTNRPFATATYCYSDRCFFGVERSGPKITRATKRHVQDLDQFVSIERMLSGHEYGYLDREPGWITVSSRTAAYEYVSTETSGQYLYTSKDMIGFDPDRHKGSIQIFPDSTIGKLIFAAMDEVFDPIVGEDLHLREAVLDEFFACLKIALGTNPRREDVRTHARSALYKLICRHIEENLSDPLLNVDSILSDFGVSRASLYRMFEPVGGVRNYIMERRAVRAVLDIAALEPERGLMRRISERWGFSSQPNFNRTIQRLFGASPGSLLDVDAGASSRRRVVRYLDNPAYRERFLPRGLAA